MKGISPIIASVLLIAIVMSIAVVLAAYVTSFTRSTISNIPEGCVGGALFYVNMANNPDLTGTTLTAAIESQFVTLSVFKFDVRHDNLTIVSYSTTGVSSLAPGDSGTITATIDPTNVDEVRVTTNCFNVRSDWASV